jgi:hypothetical protein
MKQKQHHHKWKKKKVENPQNKILKYALEHCENVNERKNEKLKIYRTS